MESQKATYTIKINTKVSPQFTINPLLNVLYLYQYGLLIPLLIFFDSQLPIVAFTLILMLALFFTNGIKVSLSILALLCIPVILILLKTIFTPIVIGPDNTKEILVGFLSIGVSGILIGSSSYNLDRFLYYGTKVGWINFIILCSMPFLGIVNDIGYMRFGYAMLPTFCFSVCSLFRQDHRRINGTIVFISGIEIAIFGARGATLAAFVCLILAFFLFSSRRKRATFLSIIIILMLCIKPILYAIRGILDFLGYYSYALTKTIWLVEGTLSGDIGTVSSGRDKLYETALETISNYPVFGTPLNSSFVTTGSDYYHNIVLDIFANYGVIIFFLFFLFIAYSFIKMTKTKNICLQWIYCLLFVLSFGRLMVSSVFWLRPEFWLFMAFFISKKKYF